MADWLDQFRRREADFRGAAVALLRTGAPADNAPLRLALAWQAVDPTWEPPADPCPATESAIWRWIWEGVDVDEGEIARAAGVAIEDVRHYLPQLIANRLIYPDGTVSSVVQDVANRAVIDQTLPKGLG